MYKILHKFAMPIGHGIQRRGTREDDAAASPTKQAPAGETSR